MSTSTEAPARKPLWGEGIDIPFFGVCGEHNSGKTLALIEILPERTVYTGFELSATTYSNMVNLGLMYEASKEVPKKYPNYRPVDSWLWWEATMLALPPGKFDVAAIDTIGDMEDGLPDHVASLYANYGFSSADNFRSTKGIFWGHVQDYLQKKLLEIMRKTGIQTIAFAAHMKTPWVDGKPVANVRETEGKKVWLKLATVLLRLERKYNAKGALPDAPNAIVVKSRLAVPKKNAAGEIERDEFGRSQWVTVLPAAIPSFCPGSIRFYIKNPANLEKPKKGETVEIPVMTEEQKLAMQSEIAANDRAAAEAKLQTMQMVQGAAQRAAEYAKSGPQATATFTAADGTTANVTLQVPPAEQKPEAAPAGSDTPPVAGDEQPIPVKKQVIDDIKQLRSDLAINDAAWAANLAKRNVTQLEDASLESLQEIRTRLWNLHTQRTLEKDLAKKSAS
jgi:hypothetical protein